MKMKYPPDWKYKRELGRGVYAFRYGVMLLGVPMLLVALIYHLYNQNIYGFIGSAVILVPGMVWIGWRHGIKQFDTYDKAFREDCGIEVSATSHADQTTFQLVCGGEHRGPYALDQIKSMWSMGAITADTLYLNEADATWKPLREFLSTQGRR